MYHLDELLLLFMLPLSASYLFSVDCLEVEIPIADLLSQGFLHLCLGKECISTLMTYAEAEYDLDISA